MVKSLIFLVLIVAANSVLFGQSVPEYNEQVDINAVRFEGLGIKEQTVRNVFFRLATRYDIPVGIELAQNDEIDLAFYTLDFKGGTLSELMNEAIEAVNIGPNRYTWELADGVVHIFPEPGYQAPVLDRLLRVEIADFSMTKGSSCRGFVESLTRSPKMREALDSNGIKLAGENFSGFYFPMMGKEFEIEARNMSLKAVLDKAVKESPVARSWAINLYEASNSFNLVVNARSENMPKIYLSSDWGDELDLESN